MAETLAKHAQGTFCWPEVGSPDPEASKKFYGELFGWTFTDTPLPPEAGGGSYTIFKLNGKDVAAMYRLGEEMKKQGIPPNWGAYVAAESADDAAKKCVALGGQVIMEPMEVMEHGRMAVLQDPAGAHFSVWQARTHAGAGVLDETGALAWTELMTGDTAKAKAFYTALLGWSAEDMPMGPETYTVFKRADGKSAAGMMAIPPMMKNVPPHWTSYFQVADLRASLAKAQSLGAKTVVDATPVPNVGEFAVLEDPHGATFALLQPQF